MIDVFQQGVDGFGNYRVPALLKLKCGTLLAFCEARKCLSDHAQNKIVLRRSHDSGTTWSSIQVVAGAGQNSLNNPLVIQDTVSGDVILMYQEYPFAEPNDVDDEKQWISHTAQDFPPNIHEGAVVEGYEGKVCRTYMQRSHDSGRSWSKPEDITRQVKRPITVTSYAGGPGTGIQLTSDKFKNRIVMPFSQGPWGSMKVYAVISDDSGKSWQLGKVAPASASEQANEVQIAELEDGGLLLNARSFKGNKLRKTAISEDGGVSWSHLTDARDLVEPECQGSMISVRGNGVVTRLLYCGPADAATRHRGVLKQSTNGGVSWQRLATVYESFFAYSSVCQLNGSQVGVLFERDAYSKISFRSMNIEP